MAFLGLALAVLVIGVVFVNGWTDAPNAIATAVSTKALSYRAAVRLAAVCNLAGLVVMSLVNASVADTIADLADLQGLPPEQATAALCSAMAAIVLFAVGAWYFGIPTSESHALAAALAGASLALGGSLRPAPWAKVFQGLFISLFLGCFLGWASAKLLGGPLTRCSPRTLDRLQICSAGGMAFLHGAQDGQKFLAVFVMARLLRQGLPLSGSIPVRGNLPALILIGVVMALGTAVGGKRIIIAVGSKMVHLQKYQGVCADLAGGLCLLAASLTGIPMSTTHTKTSAVMGAGAARGKRSLDKRVAGGMIAAWAVTFPVCGAIGFLLCRALAGLVG